MKEICICAAVIGKNGMIIRGHRHSDAIRTSFDIPGQEYNHGEQGFVTSKNRFVDRVEGLRLQLKAGIISHNHGGYSNELFSEDLY